MSEKQPDEVAGAEKLPESVPKDEMAMADSQKSNDTHHEQSQPQVNDNLSNSSTTTTNAAVNSQEESGTGGHDRHVSFDVSVTGSMKKNRLFGRQKPVHSVLGGGKRKDLSPFFILYKHMPFHVPRTCLRATYLEFTFRILFVYIIFV